MDRLSTDEIRELLARLSTLMQEQKEELIRLDGLVGDGDLGLTMAKGFKAAADEAAGSEEGDVGRLLMKAGMAMARSAPSTMGTLMATGLISGGKAVSGEEALDGPALARFLAAFVEGVMNRGKAKRGEKTLLDVLAPAAEELQRAVDEGRGLPDAVEAAYEGARRGYEESKGLIAQHGRIAYYGERSRGAVDPGAAAALVFIQGLREFTIG